MLTVVFPVFFFKLVFVVFDSSPSNIAHSHATFGGHFFDIIITISIAKSCGYRNFLGYLRRLWGRQFQLHRLPEKMVERKSVTRLNNCEVHIGQTNKQTYQPYELLNIFKVHKLVKIYPRILLRFGEFQAPVIFK